MSQPLKCNLGGVPWYGLSRGEGAITPRKMREDYHLSPAQFELRSDGPSTAELYPHKAATRSWTLWVSESKQEEVVLFGYLVYTGRAILFGYLSPQRRGCSFWVSESTRGGGGHPLVSRSFYRISRLQ